MSKVTKTTLSYCRRNGFTPSYSTSAHIAIKSTSLPSLLVFLSLSGVQKGGGEGGRKNKFRNLILHTYPCSSVVDPDPDEMGCLDPDPGDKNRK
jgi:hypothetical protein